MAEMMGEGKDSSESLADKKTRVAKERQEEARSKAQNHPIIREAQSLFGGELGPIELSERVRETERVGMQTAHKTDPVSKLIYELSKLPGIGEKTATRLAYFILKQDESYSRNLAEALINAKQKIILCGQCFTFTDTDPCRICANPERDRSSICVVERPSDVFSVEQSGAYKGIYHVLHGILSPLDGIGPDELKIRELISRARPEQHRSAKSSSRRIQASKVRRPRFTSRA